MPTDRHPIASRHSSFPPPVASTAAWWRVQSMCVPTPEASTAAWWKVLSNCYTSHLPPAVDDLASRQQLTVFVGHIIAGAAMVDHRNLEAPARRHSPHGFSQLVFREEVRDEATHSQTHLASAVVRFCAPLRSCLRDVDLFNL